MYQNISLFLYVYVYIQMCVYTYKNMHTQIFSHTLHTLFTQEVTGQLATILSMMQDEDDTASPVKKLKKNTSGPLLVFHDVVHDVESPIVNR